MNGHWRPSISINGSNYVYWAISALLTCVGGWGLFNAMHAGVVRWGITPAPNRWCSRKLWSFSWAYTSLVYLAATAPCWCRPSTAVSEVITHRRTRPVLAPGSLFVAVGFVCANPLPSLSLFASSRTTSVPLSPLLPSPLFLSHVHSYTSCRPGRGGGGGSPDADKSKEQSVLCAAGMCVHRNV